MDLPERGRLAQDSTFYVPDLVGHQVERLLAVVDADEPGRVCMLYVKTKNSPAWHRFFLDAGFAVWEDWGRITEDEDGDQVRIVDVASRHGLVGDVIVSAGAAERPELGCHFALTFRSGATVLLHPTSPRDIDSPSTLKVSLPASS